MQSVSPPNSIQRDRIDEASTNAVIQNGGKVAKSAFLHIFISAFCEVEVSQTAKFRHFYVSYVELNMAESLAV